MEKPPEKKNHTLTELFVSSPILSDLLKKVEQLSRINRLVLDKLEPQLAKHCRVVSCNGGILILSTSSPVWGHTLRFKELDILTALRGYPEYSGLKSVRCCVTPHEAVNPEDIPPLPFPKPVLTHVGAEFLKIAALQIKSDRLKLALNQLASRGSRPADKPL